MLIYFSCANYLSFKDEVTLNMLASAPVKEFQDDNIFQADRYKLLKSAVIYGANASGKSNLIKAMSKMVQIIDNSAKNLQANETLGIEEFKLNSETIGKPSKFEICFFVNDIKYRYGFEADNDTIKSEWLFYSKKIKETPLFLREGDDIEVYSKFEGGQGLEERTRNNALFLSVCAQFNVKTALKILDFFFCLNIVSGIHDELYKDLSVSMLLDKNENKNSVKSFIAEADMNILSIIAEKETVSKEHLPEDMPQEIKDRLTGKELTSVSSVHNVYDAEGEIVDKKIFPFNKNESEGTKKFFHLSGPIIDTLKNGKMLVIDEIDARLHPLLTKQIVKLFNSKETNPANAQLIVVSHDTNLLGSGFLRRDQIWFTEKDYSEATDLYSMVEYKLPSQKKVRNDAAYQKNYIDGRYGAIPFIGDFSAIWSDE